MIKSSMATAKKRPNKQRTSRGASFRRMAKDLRVISTNYRSEGAQSVSFDIGCFAHALAEVFDGEAAKLRAMP